MNSANTGVIDETPEEQRDENSDIGRDGVQYPADLQIPGRSLLLHFIKPC